MLQTLQSGRALAALAVLAFHLSIGMTLERNGGISPFIDYTRYGAFGVDYFFVLSGFIITFAHQNDINKPYLWGRFMYRRFARLFPVYWIYTLTFSALVFLGFGKYAIVPQNAVEWLTTLTLVRFDASTPPLAPAWTLFHELHFYAMFSLLILNKRLGITVLGIFVAVAVVYFHFPPTDQRTAISVYTSAYPLHFLMGIAAYWRYQQRGSGILDCIIGAIIVVLVAMNTPLPYSMTVTAMAAGFAFIIAGLAQMEARYKFSLPKVLNFLGDASYSIYLTHIAVLGLFLKIAVATRFNVLAGPVVTYFTVLVLTLAVGGAAYRFVERPLLKWMQSSRWSVRRTVATEA